MLYYYLRLANDQTQVEILREYNFKKLVYFLYSNEIKKASYVEF